MLACSALILCCVVAGTTAVKCCTYNPANYIPDSPHRVANCTTALADSQWCFACIGEAGCDILSRHFDQHYVGGVQFAGAAELWASEGCTDYETMTGGTHFLIRGRLCFCRRFDQCNQAYVSPGVRIIDDAKAAEIEKERERMKQLHQKYSGDTPTGDYTQHGIVTSDRAQYREKGQQQHDRSNEYLNLRTETGPQYGLIFFIVFAVVVFVIAICCIICQQHGGPVCPCGRQIV